MDKYGKAMLVVDAPDKCSECPCSVMGKTKLEFLCRIKGQLVSNRNPIPSWCPLIFLNMQQMDSILEAVNQPSNRKHVDVITYISELG